MVRYLILVLIMFTQYSFAADPTKTLGENCSVEKQETDGLQSWMGCNLTMTTKSGINDISSFIDVHSKAMGLPRGTDGLLHVETKNGLASSHQRFLQVYDHVPIYGAWVSVHGNAKGKVVAVHSRTFPEKLAGGSARKGVSDINAEEAARSAIDDHDLSKPLRHPAEPELVWYPVNDELVLAWKVTIFSTDPLGDFLTIVDAGNSNILLQENRIAFAIGSGHVFDPNPYQTLGSGSGLSDNSDANSTALSNQRIVVPLLGLDDGTGLLKGEFVDLSTLNSSTLADVDADEPSRVYDYERNDARFEQVVTYDTVDKLQRYFHSLGFDDDTGIPNGIRDFPTLANAHWYLQDQSFYSTGDDAIHMGDGGVDDGEDADIIAHEYGHAVQHDQNSSWGGGEMGAMGEGFGDYLAASFYAEKGEPVFQASNAPCVGEWDATSYSGSTPPCLRRVDGNKLYPNGLNGSVHSDGEIWSRALWDMRTAIGVRTADTLILEHHFGLPASSTMTTAAFHILTADCNVNAFANETQIRTAFCERGIFEDAVSCTDTPTYCTSTCAGGPVVVLPGMISGQAQSFKSAATLSTSGEVIIGNNADVSFESVSGTKFESGFSVQAGSTLTVKTGPIGCT